MFPSGVIERVQSIQSTNQDFQQDFTNHNCRTNDGQTSCDGLGNTNDQNAQYPDQEALYGHSKYSEKTQSSEDHMSCRDGDCSNIVHSSTLATDTVFGAELLGSAFMVMWEGDYKWYNASSEW